MTDLIRETHKVNARALELGCEPPVCLTWDIETDGGHPDVHRPSEFLSEPVQSVDSARLRAFVRMMHEVEES